MVKPRPFWLISGVLLFTLLGAAWGRHSATVPDAPKDFFKPLPLGFRDWSYQDEGMSPAEAETLEPDAFLVRRFRSPDGREAAELAVVAGHQKRTVHTPGFCMSGGGWELLAQQEQSLALGSVKVPVTRSVMVKEGKHLLATYFFTDGSFATTSLVRFQANQLVTRIQGGLPMGALIRILVPVNRNGPAAEKLSDELARATVPQLMQQLRRVRAEAR